MENTLLTGFKGCGKTTTGTLMARRLSRPFVDLDAAIEDLCCLTNHEDGGYRAIFQHLGDQQFRELELRAALDLRSRAQQSSAPLIIALGGGALMPAQTRAILTSLGRVVYLRMPIDELIRRAEEHGYPAYVTGPEPAREFARLFALREPVYTGYADIVVDIAELSPSEAADAVIERLSPLPLGELDPFPLPLGEG